MNFKYLATGAALALGFALLGSPGATANVILTYTGNDFTTFAPPGQTTYTTSDRVTASITLSSPLGDNFSGSISPLSFSLMDGVQTITNNSGLGMTGFEFDTTSTGVISAWNILVNTTADNLINSVNVGAKVGDGGRHESPEAMGSNVDDPGVWTSSSTSVPEPPSVAVLGAGLLGLGLLWWRRRQNRDLAQ